MKDLLAVAQELGLQVEPAGEQFKACCTRPEHGDTAPSLFLSPSKQRWYCHGCARGGTAYGLVRWLKPQLTASEAAQLVYGAESGVVLQELQPKSAVAEEAAAMLFAVLMDQQMGDKPDPALLRALHDPSELENLTEV